LARLLSANHRLQRATFFAPAGAWEREILPPRLAGYEPAWLDERCRAGRVTWTRLRPHNGRSNKAAIMACTRIVDAAA
jgi:hypothetical protein